MQAGEKKMLWLYKGHHMVLAFFFFLHFLDFFLRLHFRVAGVRFPPEVGRTWFKNWFTKNG
jgi:hypothetical protein